MSLPNNYISFHDLSPEARFLWASPSIYDVIGYTPEELVGTVPYDIIFQDDHSNSRSVHKENLMNDLVASQTTVRYRGKDGQPIYCIAVFSLCYDFIVNCSTLVDPNAGIYTQLRGHSAAMNGLVGSKEEEFERLRRHHQAFATTSWNASVFEPELRVCMILNRFSRNLTVMYASSACERVFHIDSEQIIGKPILLFIRADDLSSFVEQVDMVKSTTAITHMRFWFQSPNWPQEIPCEAMLFGSPDGMVAVMRRCRPFVRKHFLGSSEQYAARNPSWSAPNSNSYPPPFGRVPNKTKGPRRNVPMSTIRSLRIVELDDDKARPMEVPEDDPTLIKDLSSMPEGYRIKIYNVQDYEEQRGEEKSSSRKAAKRDGDMDTI
ncbi:hypothetical protein EDD21DRAFT_389774 [Dissophora ornata]|nr:hypothetical protein BGZ58_003009 [Dissophora ornata]KAI8595948.1 hypothetical protein EDD21DRAFT_389774 [Dissophora ornata]